MLGLRNSCNFLSRSEVKSALNATGDFPRFASATCYTLPRGLKDSLCPLALASAITLVLVL